MTEPVPHEDPEAAFEEPWQLEAFSAVVALTRQGLFTWPEWVEDFSKVIGNEPQLVNESVTQAYYRQWSTALEIMLTKHADVTVAEVRRRHDEWNAAYLGTPHGQPVVLENRTRAVDCPPPRHDHDGDHDHPTMSRAELARRAKPLFVDPARR